MANNEFKSVINLINSGKQYPVVDLVKQNPELAATISKLVAPLARPNYDNKGERTLNVPVINNFSKISQDIQEKQNDAQSIMQLFPDMELSAQILISSIISPKDMGGGELTFSVPESLEFADVTSSLLSLTKEYFTRDYKIEPLLPKILRQVLFESGSYCVAVIPESSLDDFINGGVKISSESLAEFKTPEGKVKGLGILGDPKGTKDSASSFAFEGFTPINKAQIDTSLTFGDRRLDSVHIYDNPYLLKFPQLANKQRYSEIAKTILSKSKNSLRRSLATENSQHKKSTYNDMQMTSLVYKGRYTNSKSLIKIKTKAETTRETIGAPLIIKLPSESVIPVYTPGNEELHVGYFVLIDIEGNPLSASSAVDHFGNLQNKLSGMNSNMSTFLTEKANRAFGGDVTKLNEQIAAKMYADVIEADLLARLRNGAYGQNITVGKNDNVYRIMFSRMLANQRTNLLYIPADLVTYFANKYDNQGIGKSLLDDMRILNSLRAMSLFSRVMASIKNSIGRTGVALKLDEDDPNPQKTIETAIHEVSRTRQQYFPLGLNTPNDLVDWLQKSGYEYTFSGHPGLPDTSISFEEKSSNYVRPDTDLEDELRKRAIMAVGLSPETVDSGFSAEFATTVVANNILLTKRVMQIQEVIIPQITDHARKVAINDGNLVNNLKELVRTNREAILASIDKTLIEENIINNEDLFVDFVVGEFLNNFEISLPQPDSVTLENQSTAFDLYEAAIDKALKFYISSEIMPTDLAGEIGEKAGDLLNILKAHYMREWMNKNGYLPELNRIVSVDKDDKPNLNILEMQNEHIAALTRSAVTLLNKTYPVGAAASRDVNKITEGAELEASAAPTTGDGGGDSGSSDSGGGDDFGMGGDFDLGDDTGTEDTSDETSTEGGDEDLPDLGSLN